MCNNTCNSCLRNLNAGYFSITKNKCKMCYVLDIPTAQAKHSIKELINHYSNIEKISKTRLKSYKTIDLSKGRYCDLTFAYLQKELIKGCYYCGHNASGLDRIDNNIGHTIENCVPCCHECNTIRMDKLTHEDMKIIGKSIKKVKDAKLTASEKKTIRVIKTQEKLLNNIRAEK